jgi:hypothetical protein
VVDCVFWISFQLLSASISIPQGAGIDIDVALSYIALAFGLLVLNNCLRGGIGGGVLPYNVY